MAVNAPGRIPDDRKMDGDRKPADTATFSMVKPGAKIAVYEPNGELYYTRIFSKIVGPKGKVYVFVPAPGYPAQVRGAEQDMIKKGTMPPPNPVDVANAIMNAKDYANVRVIWEQQIGRAHV